MADNTTQMKLEEQIRDVMGHSSLTVTSRYLQTAGENARRAVAKLPRLGSGRGQKRA